MESIRFAIAGVGNVASALVQGIVRDARATASPALVWPVLAFDIHRGKVGQPLATAIRIPPNSATWLDEDLSMFLAPVLRGPCLEGLPAALAAVIPVDDAEPADVASSLRDAAAEVLVIALPTGSQRDAEAYAGAAIRAGCAVVNGMPASVANNPSIVAAAVARSAPIIGDDIKSQVGATIVHRALMDVFRTRGAKVDNTIQLDWGGDTDFLNLVVANRYDSGKRQSKTESVVWNHPGANARVSAVDYIPFLGNRKEAYTRIEGTIFGDRPVRIDVHLEVEDGFNAAGIIVPAIRCAGMALRKGVGGLLRGPSAWFCKRPPYQTSDAEALADYEGFLRGLDSSGE